MSWIFGVFDLMISSRLPCFRISIYLRDVSWCFPFWLVCLVSPNSKFGQSVGLGLLLYTWRRSVFGLPRPVFHNQHNILKGRSWGVAHTHIYIYTYDRHGSIWLGLRHSIFTSNIKRLDFLRVFLSITKQLQYIQVNTGQLLFLAEWHAQQIYTHMYIYMHT